MATKAKLYIGITVALGFALLGGSVAWLREFPDMARFLACLSLACVASTMKVRLPGLRSTISVNFVFILIGIAELSRSEIIVLSFAAALVQCLWRPKTRPKFIQVLFSACALVISTAVAYTVAHAISGQPATLIALIPAATVFFAMNTGMVSLVLALISASPLSTVWKRCHLWTFPYYLVGASIASVASTSAPAAGWRLSLLPMPLMYLVYCYFLWYVSSWSSRSQVPGILESKP
jgi:hypothetical protein